MRALFALFIRPVREDARARLPPILRATPVLVILLILWANERDFTRRAARHSPPQNPVHISPPAAIPS